MLCFTCRIRTEASFCLFSAVNTFTCWGKKGLTQEGGVSISPLQVCMVSDQSDHLVKKKKWYPLLCWWNWYQRYSLEAIQHWMTATLSIENVKFALRISTLLLWAVSLMLLQCARLKSRDEEGVCPMLVVSVKSNISVTHKDTRGKAITGAQKDEQSLKHRINRLESCLCSNLS